MVTQVIFVDNEHSALDIWIKHCAQPTKEGLTIYLKVDDKPIFFASTIKIGASPVKEKVKSQWVEQNKNIFESMLGIVLIYDSRKETGYQCLEAKSSLSLGRLNSGTAKGLALTSVEESIAKPRIEAIEKAIASGETQSYQYVHFWDNKEWLFDAWVIPLPRNEVMVIVADRLSVNALWQREYWVRQAVNNA